jgi:hypothetical protein
VGLQVAVEDRLLVRVAHGARHRLQHAGRLLRVEGTVALDPPGQVLALDEVHGQPRRAVLLAHLEDRDDVRVLEARGRRGLDPQPLLDLGPGRPLQDLERHAPAERLVAGDEDHPHAAAGQLLLDDVRADARSRSQAGRAGRGRASAGRRAQDGDVPGA